MDLPRPRLFGRHQFDNAGTAIAAIRAAGLKVPASAFEQGVLKAEWPARMQRLAGGNLPPLAPAGSELWLDGSHNAEGKFQPVQWTAPKSGQRWFCTCKQTNNPPFCDGSHKNLG